MRKRWMFLALIVSMVIASAWSNPPVSAFFHNILDPALNPLLSWSVFWGMTFIVFVITLVMTFVQKYGTDQETLKYIKKEQKRIQADMKKYKEHPEKVMQLNKEQMEFMGKMFKLSMGSIVYTAIPFVLLIRWFSDYFTANTFLFFGFMTWFWFYLLGSIVMSSILRKIFDVA
jgi:uncharacterized membrane protein (DUF106 family)